jgi:hypothetical protein
VASLAGSGSATAATAAGAATVGTAVLWLPGAASAPEASSQLVRSTDLAGAEPRRAAGADGPPGLWPFVVPTLAFPADLALDLLLVTADHQSPDLHPGASVTTLAAVAGLALEVVAGGRVLPELANEDSRWLARWTLLAGDRDGPRPRLLAAALPPVCRALDLNATPRPGSGAADRSDGQGPDGGGSGAQPQAIVDHALGAFADAACRSGLRRARRSLAPAARPRTSGPAPAAEAWLTALAAEAPEVDADAGELAKLERLVTEWRAGAAGRAGPWRLCFRLAEPPAAEGAVQGNDGGDGTGGAEDGERTWRVDLLLQATDDLSLMVTADEVWRSGTVLRQAARTLDAPHEVLLTELGRAVRAYPELDVALREAAPTGLDIDLTGAHRFLTQVAPALEVAGFGVLLPAWWRRPSARLGLRLRATTPRTGGEGSGLLTQDGLCTFDWQAALGDQKLGLTELRRLAKLKAPLVQVRGRWMELRPGEAEQLVRFLTDDRRSRGLAMTVPELLGVAAGADQAVEGIPVVQVEADGPLGAFLRGETEAALDVRGTPEGFSGQLRPYQARGVAWLELLERTGLGACLADDMGLGKTATVLALVQADRAAAAPAAKGSAPARTTRRKVASAPARTTRRKKEAAATAPGPPGPTLVVCPTSVVGNWQREAERFTPDLRVHVHHGTTRSRADAFAATVATADLVITSYPLVDRDRAALAAVEWHRVVLDEAQNVKNPEAKQTKAVRSLRSSRRVALTGTPVENHLGELWSIMEILNPGLLGSASTFRERFAVPIERYREEEPAEQLRTLTRPFVLRRLKTDRTIITDLPDKLEMKVHCTLTREQATLYQAVVDEMLRRIDETEGIERKGLVLSTMLRLKQVCNHPAQYLGDGSSLAGRSGKLERTVEILDEVCQGGEKALVFSQYAEMGTLLHRHLQERLGCRVAFLHGGVARKERDRMVAELQDGDDVPVMVLSLKAGGTGLNLTAANHVVHFDRWWNPAVENQATDRAFRIGQRRDVQVRKLVCAGTLEDRIDEMIDAKRDLADRIVGGGESWLTELSTDDLVEVFRLSASAVEGP